MAEIKNYDSEFCGSIPIQHINRIQSYGYLLVLDLAKLTIIQLSENCGEILNRDFSACINLPFADICSAGDWDKLKYSVSKKMKDKVPVGFSIKRDDKDIRLQGLMHIKDEYVIIELEQTGTHTERTFSTVFQEVKHISGAINQAGSISEVAEITVQELRKLSGFDGVLMYRFDENWNGMVIAEDKDDRLEPYLGQTFPASDIPKQARELYLKNPYRLIPDRDYTPVALFPVLNPITFSFIDLSDCNLRAVAAVHLEYMKNMGISASMSIRIIRDEKLWGLISCHHITPHYLDYEICSMFEWLSAVISTRISILMDKETSAHVAQLHLDRTALIDQVYAKSDIISGLLQQEGPNIARLFEADGAVIYLNGRIETIGSVPPPEALEDLHLWLQGKNGGKVFATNHFAGSNEEAAIYAPIGSGILVIPVDNEKGDYVVCLRPEVVETISWGGNPQQAIHFDADGKNYHPRNSFKLWKQEIRNHSLPWKAEELEIAETLRSFLFEFRTKQLYI